MYTFIELRIFSRYASDYFTDDECAQLQIALSKNPKQGDIVQGMRGVRKLRWSRQGSEKRGGVGIL